MIASSRLTSSHLESVTFVEPVRITTDVGQTLEVAPEKFSMTLPLSRSGGEKFSPELTEEPACLEERVKSWTGTVLQTRPTRRTGVTLDLLFQCLALSQLKIGHGDLAKPDKDGEEDKGKEETMQRSED